MLARASALRHPVGDAVVDMPRLVPSFSSKGFRSFEESRTGRKYSRTALALEQMGPHIKDSILVSAYDIHHQHLREPERFYGGKELVFIDSGGYELSSYWDSTEPAKPPFRAKRFTLTDYKRVLRNLPQGIPFVITNYDWGTKWRPIEEQVRAAQALFNRCPTCLHNFLVKPSSQKRYLDITELTAHVGKLRAFHIIGVTEKELGHDLLERLQVLAKLRAAMDREKMSAPIHVWGGLDPVVSPLYFLVGAELFDGVSWLRYAYRKGVAICRDAYCVLELGMESSGEPAEALTLAHNARHLQRLTTALRRFVDEGGEGFDMFGEVGPALEDAFHTLRTKIPELKGGKK